MPTASRVAGSMRTSLPVRPAGASTRRNRGANVRSSNPMPPLAPGSGTGVNRSLGGELEAAGGAAAVETDGTSRVAVFVFAVLATGGGAELCVERQPAKTRVTTSALLRFIHELLPDATNVVLRTNRRISSHVRQGPNRPGMTPLAYLGSP